MDLGLRFTSLGNGHLIYSCFSRFCQLYELSGGFSCGSSIYAD